MLDCPFFGQSARPKDLYKKSLEIRLKEWNMDTNKNKIREPYHSSQSEYSSFHWLCGDESYSTDIDLLFYSQVEDRYQIEAIVEIKYKMKLSFEKFEAQSQNQMNLLISNALQVPYYLKVLKGKEEGEHKMNSKSRRENRSIESYVHQFYRLEDTEIYVEYRYKNYKLKPVAVLLAGRRKHDLNNRDIQIVLLIAEALNVDPFFVEYFIPHHKDHHRYSLIFDRKRHFHFTITDLNTGFTFCKTFDGMIEWIKRL